MKRLILVCAVLWSFNAFAAQGGEGNNTGCNGVGNSNSPCDPGSVVTTNAGGTGGTATSNSTATGGSATASGGSATAFGGAGGRGGDGGAGVGIGGTGGEANNSLNVNFNPANNVTTRNQQSSTNNVSNSQTQSQGQEVTNAANNTGTSTSTSSNAVVVQGDQAQARNPVSTALGPTIVTGSDQCLVALSVGVQAVGFGFAAGSAIADTNCEVLKLARQLDSMGYKTQALKLLMADPRVKAAFE